MRRKHCNMLLFALLMLMEFGILPEIQSIGFYCGDPKISHKFNGDTVSLKALLTSVLLLPYGVLCCVEYFCNGKHSKRGDSPRTWMAQSFIWYKEYLSGLLIVFFLTCLGKVLVGEPRPHFLDTCKPYEAINCTSEYVASYTCTNSELSNVRVRDASKSFPSGHASLSIFLFTFFAWYLQQRLVGVSSLLVAWLQVVFLSWALICSVSRISDHRHHWWDVLAGSILGASLANYTVCYFCDTFQVGNYRNLHHHDLDTAEKSEIKPNNNIFKSNVSGRRLLTTPTDPANQVLADDTST